jgi:hypothetical protein
MFVYSFDVELSVMQAVAVYILIQNCVKDMFGKP